LSSCGAGTPQYYRYRNVRLSAWPWHALAGNPRLLLLDEPMAHLNMQLKIGLLEELKSLQQKLNLTTVCITHDCGS
jgi:ABC-type cobalamin/Fe3+-siderophores transport system ATPase subunit